MEKVGFQDGGGVGVVEFGGFGTGGEVGGDEVVERESGQGWSVPSIQERFRSRENGRLTGHVELLCWNRHGRRSAQGMRARGCSLPLAHRSHMIGACQDIR